MRHKRFLQEELESSANSTLKDNDEFALKAKEIVREDETTTTTTTKTIIKEETPEGVGEEALLLWEKLIQYWARS